MFLLRIVDWWLLNLSEKFLVNIVKHGEMKCQWRLNIKNYNPEK